MFGDGVFSRAFDRRFSAHRLGIFRYWLRSHSISPIPGTPQWDYLTKSGLLRIEDPSVVGEFWTASCDTHYLRYEEVSNWQVRLGEIGKHDSKLLNYHGGLTMVSKGDRQQIID